MNKNKIELIAISCVCIALTIGTVALMVDLTDSLHAKDEQIAYQQSIISDQQVTIDDQNRTINRLNYIMGEKNDTIREQGIAIEFLTSQLIKKEHELEVVNQDVTRLESILNGSYADNLQTFVYHVKETGDDLGRLPDVNYTYNQLLALDNGTHDILLLPEYYGNEDWNATFDWLKTNFANNEPLMLPLFEAGNESTPILMLSLDQIETAVNTFNVRALRIAEMVSYYKDFPNQTFPTTWVTDVLTFARSRGLWVAWNEWKVNDHTFEQLQNCTRGFEDVVVICFATNSGEMQPADGFMLMDEMFPNWGASIQAWYWKTYYNEDPLNMPQSLLVEHALMARNIGAKIIQIEPYWYFLDNGEPKDSLRLLMAILGN